MTPGMIYGFRVLGLVLITAIALAALLDDNLGFQLIHKSSRWRARSGSGNISNITVNILPKNVYNSSVSTPEDPHPSRSVNKTSSSDNSPEQSLSPTYNPTYIPTSSPTSNPTSSPTSSPTSNPTSSPTSSPTVNPTSKPTSLSVISNKSFTIICNLQGETGNYLSGIAYGYGMSWILKEDYGLDTQLVFQHNNRNHNNRKKTKGGISMAKCFPNIRPLDLKEGNNDEFTQRHEQQLTWLGEDVNNQLRTDINCQDELCIRNTLESFIQIITSSNNHNQSAPPELPENPRITLPFLFTQTFASLSYINDRYYERLRNLFTYDEGNPECCAERSMAAPEVALHARGFLSEMPRMGERLGFKELSVNKTVSELMNSSTTYPPGTRLAVLGRYQEHAELYVTALNEDGLFQARYIATETGEQSLCYLMSVQNEIVGISMSSFAIWAAYLGNATKVRLYSIKSPIRENVYPNGTYFFRYNYTNPFLREKISFELYNSEEQDALDAGQG